MRARRPIYARAGPCVRTHRLAGTDVGAAVAALPSVCLRRERARRARPFICTRAAWAAWPPNAADADAEPLPHASVPRRSTARTLATTCRPDRTGPKHRFAPSAAARRAHRCPNTLSSPCRALNRSALLAAPVCELQEKARPEARWALRRAWPGWWHSRGHVTTRTRTRTASAQVPVRQRSRRWRMARRG